MKNPTWFRVATGFFIISLVLCVLLLVGALFFFSFPSVGIWFSEL